jgi:hypothetical protein
VKQKIGSPHPPSHPTRPKNAPAQFSHVRQPIPYQNDKTRGNRERLFFFPFSFSSSSTDFSGIFIFFPPSIENNSNNNNNKEKMDIFPIDT